MRKSTVAAVVIASVAVLGLSAAPSSAQNAPPPPGAEKVVGSKAAAKRTPAPTQVAVAGRPPARVTVRKRSYLDPGTETKRGEERRHDYAFPPGDPVFIDPTDFRINWTRAPLPSCFDLPGFCH